MKILHKNLVLFIFLFAGTRSVDAQNNFFKDVTETSLKTGHQKRVIIPSKYRTLLLNTNGLLSFIKPIPSEENIRDRKHTPVIQIPMPDGRSNRFHIWESSIMEPELAAKFPELKTFTGQGIDDPTATIKLDWTASGFHAMILSNVTGAVFIDPYAQDTQTGYIAYFKADLKKSGSYFETIFPAGESNIKRPVAPEHTLAGICSGTQLRTYRLAVACTGEYAKAATGITSPTVAQTLAKITTTVNRVNGVYEKELAIRLVLIANENQIIFTNPTTDPFNGNNNPGVLIDESQSVITTIIGNANYDIGHTFSTGGGGAATPGVVCVTGNKARGITGIASPVGDPYDIDYVSHEIGHQFGADHTFNSTTGGCQSGGNITINVEPGSGSTIMAYAGVCVSDNLQSNSDPYFNTISFDEIMAYSNASSGNNCAVITNTGNIPPVVNAGADYTIPLSTPFFLVGSATDANGDALTYCWEEVDAGGPFGPWNAPSGNAPIFRSFMPTTSATRYFPKLVDVLNNTTTVGEILPSYERTMHFRLTARDNKASGGGVCYDETTITIDNKGPFTVTYPTLAGITWSVGEFVTVTWNTGGTEGSPVNCTNVSIQLSLDGGSNYPVTLATNILNDGSEVIQVPGKPTTSARIRIVATGNIFYDISNNNFKIQNSTSLFRYTFTGNGNWNTAANWSNSAIPPPVLPSGSEIIIDPTPGGECILNIQQTISPGAKFILQPGKNIRILGDLIIN